MPENKLTSIIPTGFFSVIHPNLYNSTLEDRLNKENLTYCKWRQWQQQELLWEITFYEVCNRLHYL